MIAGLQQKLWTCDFCFHQEPSAFSNGSFQVFILWEKPFYYELKYRSSWAGPSSRRPSRSNRDPWQGHSQLRVSGFHSS